MSDYRINIAVKNNRILERMEMAGHKNVNSFCVMFDLSPTDIGRYVNLKKPPRNKRGDWLPTATRIAACLGCNPDDLWSPEQQYSELVTNKSHVVVEEGRLKQLMVDGSPDILSGFIEDESAKLLADELNKLIGTLTPREQEIIRMRQGLGPFERVYTAAEVGARFEIGAQRVLQLEARALRKMRHPVRNAKVAYLAGVREDEPVIKRALIGDLQEGSILDISGSRFWVVSSRHKKRGVGEVITLSDRRGGYRDITQRKFRVKVDDLGDGVYQYRGML